jgi:hypothetical protein
MGCWQLKVGANGYDSASLRRGDGVHGQAVVNEAMRREGSRRHSRSGVCERVARLGGIE